MGYRVVEGPEVELDYYNFTALNIPPAIRRGCSRTPSTSRTTLLLRTHTSPMQVRAMEAQAPPIYIIVPGRVYRRDSDATHTPMFTPGRGPGVDEDITLADLRGTLLEFARAIFGGAQRVRLRAGYFPFTEPSVEVDVSCFACNASGRAPRRLALLALQGQRLDRDPRRRDGGPERVRLRRATTATTPSACRASPSASASSGSRC